MTNPRCPVLVRHSCSSLIEFHLAHLLNIMLLICCTVFLVKQVEERSPRFFLLNQSRQIEAIGFLSSESAWATSIDKLSSLSVMGLPGATADLTKERRKRDDRHQDEAMEALVECIYNAATRKWTVLGIRTDRDLPDRLEDAFKLVSPCSLRPDHCSWLTWHYVR